MSRPGGPLAGAPRARTPGTGARGGQDRVGRVPAQVHDGPDGPTGAHPLTPVLAIPVVMKRCSSEKTIVIGSSVNTVIAST